MLHSLREETESKLQMLLSLRKNGLDSLFKEVRVLKEHKQICAGLFRDWVSVKNFVLMCFWGHSLWGEKAHKQNPPKKFVTLLFMLFLYVFFCSQRETQATHLVPIPKHPRWAPRKKFVYVVGNKIFTVCFAPPLQLCTV